MTITAYISGAYTTVEQGRTQYEAQKRARKSIVESADFGLLEDADWKEPVLVDHDPNSDEWTFSFEVYGYADYDCETEDMEQVLEAAEEYFYECDFGDLKDVQWSVLDN